MVFGFSRNKRSETEKRNGFWVRNWFRNWYDTAMKVYTCVDNETTMTTCEKNQIETSNMPISNWWNAKVVLILIYFFKMLLMFLFLFFWLMYIIKYLYVLLHWKCDFSCFHVINNSNNEKKENEVHIVGRSWNHISSYIIYTHDTIHISDCGRSVVYSFNFFSPIIMTINVSLYLSLSQCVMWCIWALL